MARDASTASSAEECIFHIVSYYDESGKKETSPPVQPVHIAPIDPFWYTEIFDININMSKISKATKRWQKAKTKGSDGKSPKSPKSRGGVEKKAVKGTPVGGKGRSGKPHSSAGAGKKGSKGEEQCKQRERDTGTLYV